MWGKITGLRLIFCVYLVTGVHLKTAFAGVPDVDLFMVTDVTTRSFSVIWSSSEPSTCSLEVFADSAGEFPVSNVSIEPHPVNSGSADIRTAAEDNGVMKVRVSGLEPDTFYYFRAQTISKSTSDEVFFPETEPLWQVITESQTERTLVSGQDILPFANDVIIHPCYQADGVTPAVGTILIATVSGADYPTSAFVGDGVPLPYALIDLNNVYDMDSHVSLDLQQGERMMLLNYRGIGGNAIVGQRIPADNSLAEVKSADELYLEGWNMVSLQLDPTTPGTASVLDPVLDKISSVWAYDASTGSWLSYDTSVPGFLNSLNTLQSGQGYWVNFKEPASILIQDGSFPAFGLPLVSGWNFVGQQAIEASPVVLAFSTISSSLQSAWTYDSEASGWLSYDTTVPPFLNTLNIIEPGTSYWVNVSEDVVW